MQGVSASISHIRSTCLREAATAKAGEIRNSKWFGRLTILSKVEGQYRMTKIQMTQTLERVLLAPKPEKGGCFRHWDIRASNLFRISVFEFRI
jgi:hypothetical protein